MVVEGLSASIRGLVFDGKPSSIDDVAGGVLAVTFPGVIAVTDSINDSVRRDGVRAGRRSGSGSPSRIGLRILASARAQRATALGRAARSRCKISCIFWVPNRVILGTGVSYSLSYLSYGSYR